MGRGTDVSAGSSVRDAALHPGGVQALPPVAAQRGMNPGQLHLPVTAEARMGRSWHVLGLAWATMLCLHCPLCSLGRAQPFGVLMLSAQSAAVVQLVLARLLCPSPLFRAVQCEPQEQQGRGSCRAGRVPPSLPLCLLVTTAGGHCPFPACSQLQGQLLWGSRHVLPRHK